MELIVKPNFPVLFTQSGFSQSKSIITDLLFVGYSTMINKVLSMKTHNFPLLKLVRCKARNDCHEEQQWKTCASALTEGNK